MGDGVLKQAEEYMAANPGEPWRSLSNTFAMLAGDAKPDTRVYLRLVSGGIWPVYSEDVITVATHLSNPAHSFVTIRQGCQRQSKFVVGDGADVKRRLGMEESTRRARQVLSQEAVQSPSTSQTYTQDAHNESWKRVAEAATRERDEAIAKLDKAIADGVKLMDDLDEANRLRQTVTRNYAAVEMARDDAIDAHNESQASLAKVTAQRDEALGRMADAETRYEEAVRLKGVALAALETLRAEQPSERSIVIDPAASERAAQVCAAVEYIVKVRMNDSAANVLMRIAEDSSWYKQTLGVLKSSSLSSRASNGAPGEGEGTCSCQPGTPRVAGDNESPQPDAATVGETP